MNTSAPGNDSLAITAGTPREHKLPPSLCQQAPWAGSVQRPGAQAIGLRGLLGPSLMPTLLLAPTLTPASAWFPHRSKLSRRRSAQMRV